MATKAQQVDFLLSPVREPGSGLIVTDGRVFFCAPGGGINNLVTVYANRNKTVTAANPFSLGSDGTGSVFVDGVVDIVIKHSNGYDTDHQDQWTQIKTISGVAYKTQPDPIERVFEDEGWATLNEAITAIGSAETELVINSTVTMTGNVTIPTTCRIIPTRKGYINQSIHTLTINSWFDRGRVRVFVGTGPVIFGAGSIEEAYPEWFSSAAGGIKLAVAAAGAVATISLSGKKTYAENEPIVNTSTRSIRIVGKVGERNDGTYNGSAISTTYNGVLFQNGSDNGQQWDGNYYDGPQGFEIEKVHIAYVGGTTETLLCGGGNYYGTGTYAIQDWRGGHIRLRDVVFANFDYAFWGVQSDFNRFENVQLRSCKHGIYAGPRSDQFVINELSISLCDQGLIIDGAEVQVTNPSCVGSGYQGTPPIEILQVGAVNRLVTIKEPQLERYQGASYVNAFIGIGINPGYNGASNTPRVEIDAVQFWTNTQGSGSGYAKYVVEIGKGIVDMEVVTGDISNIDHIVSWVGAHTGADAICRLVGLDNLDSKAFIDNGTGTKTQLLDTYGTGGKTVTQTVNQHIFRKFGSTLQSFALLMSTDRQFVVSLCDSGFRSKNILQVQKRHIIGLRTYIDGSISDNPVTGTWDVDDSFTYIYSGTTAVAHHGKRCTRGGTTDTISTTGSITTGTKLLTVVSTSNMFKGDYITIAGVTGIHEIADINTTTKVVTLVANADATAAGAAVANSLPKFKVYGAVTGSEV